MAEASPENERWVLGVTLGLLGSIAINTGNNIQSLGLKALEKSEPPPTQEPITGKQKTSALPSLSWLSPPGGKSPIRRKHSLPWSPSGAMTVPKNSNEEDSEFVVVKVGKKSPFKSITWVIGTIIFVTGSLLNFASYAFAAQSMLASLESVQFVTNLIFGKFMLGAHVVRIQLTIPSLLWLDHGSYLTTFPCTDPDDGGWDLPHSYWHCNGRAIQ